MDDLERCYATALRILKVRWNASRELKTKLQARRFDRDVIQTTLARLAEEKWLDDARYADAYARQRAARRIGALRIRQELIAVGVDRETADHAVKANFDGDAERERATALARKRLPILQRRYELRIARNKLTAYLLKQGYDGALVRDIVKEIAVAHD